MRCATGFCISIIYDGQGSSESFRKVKVDAAGVVVETYKKPHGQTPNLDLKNTFGRPHPGTPGQGILAATKRPPIPIVQKTRYRIHDKSALSLLVVRLLHKTRINTRALFHISHKRRLPGDLQDSSWACGDLGFQRENKGPGRMSLAHCSP
jgi:hypothetical protein